MENFIYVNSSDLNSIKVNGNNLVIMFKSGGVYEYMDAAREYYNLLNSNSKGKYFHQFIKNKYQEKKIN
ncbi:MAG: KTSC domain-containing protein [Bacilli bacterium]